MNWRPSATADGLRRRALLLTGIRDFFSARGVLEVETPLLCNSGVTDPAVEPLVVASSVSSDAPRFLQTSPEYAMKRLLGAYGEPIYQVTRAFRDGEAGARHNPEFTLLEWYRPGFDLHALMDEVAELVAACTGRRDEVRYSYREAFRHYLSVDPFTASDDELSACVRDHIDVGNMVGDRDIWLDLLMSHLIEPQLTGVCFIHDYPASQAALAKVAEVDGVPVGRRFELYVDGLELANGYRELIDPVEQRRRFESDNARRRERGQQTRSIDEHLLAAMKEGLPECSGVAMGVDRLLMVAMGRTDIREVLSFDWKRA